MECPICEKSRMMLKWHLAFDRAKFCDENNWNPNQENWGSEVQLQEDANDKAISLFHCYLIGFFGSDITDKLQRTYRDGLFILERYAK